MSSLNDWLEVFKDELKEKYTASEIKTLFYIFSQEYLGLSSAVEVISHQHAKVSMAVGHRFEEVLNQLLLGKPYQQILGKAWFFGEEFIINENTLIPRPETEELVELALSKINRQGMSILDIGTGSGCIAISLAKHLKFAQVTAIDLSPKALAVAHENARLHQVKITFIEMDYLHKSPADLFDVMISNPPYISQKEASQIETMVKDFEPTIALFSPDNDPLIFYRKISKDLPLMLKPNGYFFLEINQNFGYETLDLFKNQCSEVHLVKDISGNYRMIWGRK